MGPAPEAEENVPRGDADWVARGRETGAMPAFQGPRRAKRPRRAPKLGTDKHTPKEYITLPTDSRQLSSN